MTENADPKPEEATVWVDPTLTSPAPVKAVVKRGGRVTWISCGCAGTVNVRGPSGEIALEFEPGVPTVLQVDFPKGSYTYDVHLNKCRSPHKMAHLQGSFIIVDP